MIRFLLEKFQYCLDMGLIYGEQMRREMGPDACADDELTKFRDEILMVKLFKEDSSDSLKT